MSVRRRILGTTPCFHGSAEVSARPTLVPCVTGTRPHLSLLPAPRSCRARRALFLPSCSNWGPRRQVSGGVSLACPIPGRLVTHHSRSRRTVMPPSSQRFRPPIASRSRTTTPSSQAGRRACGNRHPQAPKLNGFLSFAFSLRYSARTGGHVQTITIQRTRVSHHALRTLHPARCRETGGREPTPCRAFGLDISHALAIHYRDRELFQARLCPQCPSPPPHTATSAFGGFSFLIPFVFLMDMDGGPTRDEGGLPCRTIFSLFLISHSS